MAFDSKLIDGTRCYVSAALGELVAHGNNFSITDADWSTFYWKASNPDDPPTEAEVATRAEELRKKDAYRLKRKGEYPRPQEQLDMQYHDQVNGTTTFKDAIAAIKTKYPKSLADSA